MVKDKAGYCRRSELHHAVRVDTHNSSRIDNGGATAMHWVPFDARKAVASRGEPCLCGHEFPSAVGRDNGRHRDGHFPEQHGLRVPLGLVAHEQAFDVDRVINAFALPVPVATLTTADSHHRPLQHMSPSGASRF